MIPELTIYKPFYSYHGILIIDNRGSFSGFFNGNSLYFIFLFGMAMSSIFFHSILGIVDHVCYYSGLLSFPPLFSIREPNTNRILIYHGIFLFNG